jgi:hypothetical protein
MKLIASIVILIGVSTSAAAQESPTRTVTTDRLGTWAPREASACDTIYGDGRQLCLADRYRMQRDQQAHEVETALMRVQAENLKLHNDLLRLELARVQTTAAAPSASELATTPGFADWQPENRWFGADHARTEYALLYAKDLRQQQPELSGRPFLNALSVRVREVFAPPKR